MAIVQSINNAYQFREAFRLAGRMVFPTPVGVFLVRCLVVLYCWGLPHARGGVSTLMI